MGGLISTVGDLASWVGYFQRGVGSPVMSDLSLLEMQRTQRLVAGVAGAAPEQSPTVSGYGFGLFEDLRSWGRSVYHSGGYPGFGSHMRWHPASGLGIVALSNGTYAAVSTAAAKALADLIDTLGCDIEVPLPQLPGLDEAVAAVDRWLAAPEPDGPEGESLRGLWADNVERDLPWAERLTSLDSLRGRFGKLSEISGSRRRVEVGTVTWDLRGTHPAVDDTGAPQVVRVVVMVAPHDTGLIQSVTLRVVKEASPPAAIALS